MKSKEEQIQHEKHLKLRYKRMFEKSFSNVLDLYLLERLLEGKDIISAKPEKFDVFLNPNNLKLRNEFSDLNRKSYQYAKGDAKFDKYDITINQISKAIKEWYDINDKNIKDYSNVYKNHFWSETDFLADFVSKEEKCEYCEITEKNIEELIKKDELKAKMLFVELNSAQAE